MIISVLRDMRNIKDGFYIVRIENGEVSEERKLINPNGSNSSKRIEPEDTGRFSPVQSGVRLKIQ